MEYRPLGPTGLSVAEICLGTGQIGWTARASDTHDLFDAYVSAGGNFVDTADIYTQWVEGHRGGESETVVGQWFKERKNRRQIILATKCRGRMWEGLTGEGLSREHVLRACDDSLRRLQTDYIDLYQSHWADPATPIEETLRAYDELIRAGKVRYIGASNFSAGQLVEAMATAAKKGLPQYTSYQPLYNLTDRGLEREHVQLMKQHQIACIPYSPIAQGFLTGKYRKDRPLPKTPRAEHVTKRLWSDKNFAIIDTLETLSRKRGKTICQMALGWHLTHDWMTAPIIGANTVEQLNDNLGAVGLKLTTEEMALLDHVSA